MFVMHMLFSVGCAVVFGLYMNEIATAIAASREVGRGSIFWAAFSGFFAIYNFCVAFLFA